MVSWFGEVVSQQDRIELKLADKPSAEDQQVLEAFTMLIALRSWAPHWKGKRVSLAVQSDNMATLAMVARMQPHSERLGRIAREIALDISASEYSPDITVHVPGLANKAADDLSRRWQPGKSAALPAYLLPEHELRLPPRDTTWWRSGPA